MAKYNIERSKIWGIIWQTDTERWASWLGYLHACDADILYACMSPVVCRQLTYSPPPKTVCAVPEVKM